MKIKVVGIGIASFLVIGLLAAGFLGTNPTNNTPVMEEAYRYIQVSADFTRAYESYEQLVSSSEAVVFGSVKKVDSYVDNSRIVSRFDFIVNSVEKGNLKDGEIISVITTGGKILYSDYLIANKEYLEAKMSTEYVSTEMEQHGNEYIESILEGVPNVNEGDTLLLFIAKSEGSVNYYILGSSYYGKFYYDVKSKEIYKLIMDENPNAKNMQTPQRMMPINRSDFTNIVSESIDTSDELSPRNSFNIKDDVEIPKDSSYDIYK